MADPADTPSVLAVLVVRGGTNVRETLAGLGAQAYPRLGVLAVDAGATEDARSLLKQALGEGRVLRADGASSMAGALDAVMRIPAAREADHLLLLHDDSALDPDCTARMIEASAVEGSRPVGIVGAKLVDPDEPRKLLDVGSSADRFGHPYSPLQEGEIDQGQYDRVLEVLFVSSAALLISAATISKIGGFDERLGPTHEELDLCWRARVCGFRVLMTPLARVRHGGTSGLDERVIQGHRSKRYGDERTALAAMLKNYRLPSLAWLLPLYASIGLIRTFVKLVSRRFEDAYDLAAAWGWNVAHLPGTLTRRWRIGSIRAVPDRAVRPFMASAGLRFPRWVETAGKIWAEQRELEEEDEDQPIQRRLRHQTTSLVRTHPAFVATFFAAVVAALALRRLPGLGIIQGGGMPSFPSAHGRILGELLSGLRTTGFGGPARPSPALAVIGAVASIAGTGFAQKLLLGASPILGGVFAYRAFLRSSRPVAAVAGSAGYALCGLMLWSFSQARIGLLIAMAVLPLVAERLTRAFYEDEPGGQGARFVVGAAAALAIGVSFYPGLALGAAVLVLGALVSGRGRRRGMALALGIAAIAALLVFPWAVSLLRTHGQALGSLVGPASFSRLARLTPGPGPGTWVTAWFLPLAAAFGLSLVRPEARRRAWGAAFAAAAGVFLAWLSSASYLPQPLSNPAAYLAASALSEAALVTLGVSGALGVRQEPFGYRQVGAALMSVTIVGGIVLQSLAASVGGWVFGGPEAVTPAWAVLSQGSPNEDRVLWIGRDDGEPFPSPGGDPQGTLSAGGVTLRYAITDQAGASILDTGRGLGGPGETYLRAALTEILSGNGVHGGALLAPLAIRYVVSGNGDLPLAVSRVLGSQLDLDRIPAIGLIIFRDPWSLPVAGSIQADAFPPDLRLTSSADISRMPQFAASALPSVSTGWSGTASGTVYLATAFDASLRASAGGVRIQPVRAFGWATAFPDVPASSIDIGSSESSSTRLQYFVVAILWLGVLWMTRRRT